MRGLLHRRAPKRLWGAVRRRSPRLPVPGRACPPVPADPDGRSMPYRPWRVVWCIAALGHFWWPGSDQCLDCGAWRRDR